MIDHDQRFKALIREFFPEFFQLFFQQWAERFDFATTEWLDKEVFTDPPQGGRRYLDLVAKLRTRQPVGQEEGWIVLVHIEIESAATVVPLRPRMLTYYEQLRRQHGLPVLPIALFLRVGLQGVGWDAYEEHFWEQRLLRFEYAYVGLPALPGDVFLSGTNVLGLALGALMRVPSERRLELRAEALQRMAVCGQNTYRQFLVAECLQTYLPLSEVDKMEFEKLLKEARYQEARAMSRTYFEEGQVTGYEQGRMSGFRETLRFQLETRFGPLQPEVLARISALDSAQLEDVLRRVIDASSLHDLGLEG